MAASKMAYVYVWNDGLHLTVIEIYLILLVKICFAVKKNTIQYNTTQYNFKIKSQNIEHMKGLKTTLDTKYINHT